MLLFGFWKVRVWFHCFCFCKLVVVVIVAVDVVVVVIVAVAVVFFYVVVFVVYSEYRRTLPTRVTIGCPLNLV